MQHALMRIGIGVLLLTAVTGCDRTESDWKQAKDANTAAAYSDFLAKHPQGAHADEAKADLIQADYEAAKHEDTVSAYNAFLAKWADCAQAKDAAKLMQQRQELDDLEKDDAPAPIDPGARSLRLFKGPDGTLRQSGETSFSIGGGTSSEDYSNTHITNEAGEPLGLISITRGDREVGTLYVTGNEASFDANTKLVRGSGFLLAAPGEHLSIVFTGKDTNGDMTQIQLGVERIEWDDGGKTIKVQGLSPVVQQLLRPDMKIKSDLTNPDVINGILTVAVEGGKEFKFKIRFGNGTKYLEISQQ